MDNFLREYAMSIFITLMSSIGYLCFYIYDHSQDEVHDTSHKVDDVQTRQWEDKFETIDKMYNLVMISNEKISDLKVNAATSEGNYRELSLKVDTFIESTKEDRKFYMSKFDDYEKRIVRLEKSDTIQDKNIQTLAQDRGVQLFSFKY